MNPKKVALFFLILVLSACASSTKIAERNTLAENNKDFYILSHIIRDYFDYQFRHSNSCERENLNDFIKSGFVKDDSLKRILNNFEAFDVRGEGAGYAVYFKFSKSRQTKGINLTTKENDFLNKAIRVSNDTSDKYDGKILFAYPEKFYHIRKIIVKK